MRHNKKGYQKNNKFKGKGNDSSSNQNNGRREVKFAPVSKNANFAPYSTVKKAYLLKIQETQYKSKALLVKAITDEKEPDFSTMKPERYYAS